MNNDKKISLKLLRKDLFYHPETGQIIIKGKKPKFLELDERNVYHKYWLGNGLINIKYKNNTYYLTNLIYYYMTAFWLKKDFVCYPKDLNVRNLKWSNLSITSFKEYLIKQNTFDNNNINKISQNNFVVNFNIFVGSFRNITEAKKNRDYFINNYLK